MGEVILLDPSTWTHLSGKGKIGALLGLWGQPVPGLAIQPGANRELGDCMRASEGQRQGDPPVPTGPPPPSACSWDASAHPHPPCAQAHIHSPANPQNRPCAHFAMEMLWRVHTQRLVPDSKAATRPHSRHIHHPYAHFLPVRGVLVFTHTLPPPTRKHAITSTHAWLSAHPQEHRLAARSC